MFDDEHIIISNIAAKTAEKNTIISDVDIDIDGVIYQFERREFLSGFSIVLPKSFDYMATECVKRKYPYEERPSIILSNEDTTINFLFDCMKIKPEELSSRLKKYKAVVKKMNPSHVFYSESIIKLESGLDLALYDYIGSAIDDDIYYISFFTDLPNGELFGCFTCPIDAEARWGTLARQMIMTIETIPF